MLDMLACAESFHGRLKLVEAKASMHGSKSTPFFQMVKLIAAIFRAKVRRAIVGRIPFSIRAT
jgi:hypothetical protein